MLTAHQVCHQLVWLRLAAKYGLATQRPSKRKGGKGAPISAADLNDALKSAGVYSQPEWRQVQAWFDIRNEAAHGKTEFGARDKAQVGAMLQGVRAFITRYAA